MIHQINYYFYKIRSPFVKRKIKKAFPEGDYVKNINNDPFLIVSNNGTGVLKVLPFVTPEAGVLNLSIKDDELEVISCLEVIEYSKMKQIRKAVI